MKKLLPILTALLLLSFIGYSQKQYNSASCFQLQTLGNTKKEVNALGLLSADSGFRITYYTDTLTANKGCVKNVRYALIGTYDDTIWYRSYDIQRWIAFATGSAGVLEVTADNGLIMSTPTNVQLGDSVGPGAPLLHDTYINNDTYKIQLSGAVDDGLIVGYNTGGVGIWIEGTEGGLVAIDNSPPNDVSYTAVYGYSTNGDGGFFRGWTRGVGVQAFGDSATGLTVESADGVGVDITSGSGYTGINVVSQNGGTSGLFTHSDNTTNELSTVLEVNRQGILSGSPIYGYGSTIDFGLVGASGQDIYSQIAITGTNFSSSPIGQFEVKVINNDVLTRRLSINGSGLVTTSGYGQGNFTSGTPMYAAAWDEDGNFMEVELGGGANLDSVNNRYFDVSTLSDSSGFILIKPDGSRDTIIVNPNDAEVTVENLQETTDEGNVTTNNIIISAGSVLRVASSSPNSTHIELQNLTSGNPARQWNINLDSSDKFMLRDQNKSAIRFTIDSTGNVFIPEMDSSGSPANMMWQDPSTGELKIAAVPIGIGSLNNGSGLTYNSGASRYDLGGTLLGDADIDGDGTYGFNFSNGTLFSAVANSIVLNGTTSFAINSGGTDIFYSTGDGNFNLLSAGNSNITSITDQLNIKGDQILGLESDGLIQVFGPKFSIFTDSTYLKLPTVTSADTIVIPAYLSNGQSTLKQIAISDLSLGSSDITINSTVITGGTTSRLLYNNAGTVGELAVIPIANGGTNNGSLSVTAGNLYYGDGSKLVGLATGTSKQALRPDGSNGYVWRDTTPVYNHINVQALVSNTADATDYYFGQLPKALQISADISKVYFRNAGIITGANIYAVSGTAGSNENWTLAIRHNNTTDHNIATVALAASERVWNNQSMSITVAAGDYIEIHSLQQTWATNPASTIFAGELTFKPL